MIDAAPRSDPFRFIRLVQQSRLPPTLRHFMMHFCSWGNWDDGTSIRPGLELLMSATGMGRTNVLECLARLTAAGIIKRDGAYQRIRQYRVDAVALLQYDPAKYPARKPSGWTRDTSAGADLTHAISPQARTFDPVENSPISPQARTLELSISPQARTLRSFDRSAGADGKVRRRGRIGPQARTDRSAGADSDHIEHLDHQDHAAARTTAPVENSIQPIATLREQTERERLAIKIQKLARSAVRQARYTAGIDLPTFEIVAKHFDDHIQAGHLELDTATRERVLLEAIRASLH